MKQMLPDAVRTALQFEEKTLPNGLTLRVITIPEYRAAHAIYATHFGSIHRAFEQNGKSVLMPAGMAHFLEHKMFENEDGVDAFSLYAATGASANAYTGFERTSYIFTASTEIEKNLDILLSFVGHPHFTKETVEKEQGIISQEIKMYADDAENRALFALLASLYHNHPVRDEIVGTVETIAEITPESLYACCDAFYNPSNMVLCAAGNITMQQLEQAVAKANLPQEKAAPTTRVFPKEERGVARPWHEFEMPVSMPLLALGFKEEHPGGDTSKTEVICDLLTELICGETSSLYRRLYDEGLVQPDFSAEYGCVDEAMHFFFSTESEQPEKVREEILKEINRQRREGVDPVQFDLCKNMMYGEAVAGLESVDRVASMLSVSYFMNRTPEKEMEALANVTVEDINAALQNMMLEEYSATVIVRPQS
ncbi:MAG: EF-P 5-aminopentanol modification-associated protein YfmH [Oscillospiraceae bacterium]